MLLMKIDYKVQFRVYNNWTYRLYLVILVLIMVRTLSWGLISSARHMRKLCKYNRYCHGLLRNSWPKFKGIPRLDHADNQWRSFRESFAILAFVMILHVVVSRITQKIFIRFGTHCAIKARLLVNLSLSILFLAKLHGKNSVFTLVFSLISFGIGKVFAGSRVCVPLTWIYALMMLYIKQTGHQYISLQIFAAKEASDDNSTYPWFFPLNLFILKLISFNQDFHNARLSLHSSGEINVNADKSFSPQYSGPSSVTLKRSMLHNSDADYSLINFLVYCFYAPLYVAGPIVSFNKFQSYIQTSSALNFYQIVSYSIRLLIAFIALEVTLRIVPTFAIAKSKVFLQFSMPHLAMYSYFLLHNMWLKFLVIWRFSRLWALLEGIDPPENMPQYIASATSISSFWSNWHSSFNKWLIRYLYIPLGGRDRRWLGTFICFAFVALWHDATLEVCLWAGLNVFFVVIEDCVKLLYGYQKWVEIDSIAYRVVSSIGSAFGLLILGGVNLTGYAIGSEGVEFLTSKVLHFSALRCVLLTSLYVFCSVQIFRAIDDGVSWLSLRKQSNPQRIYKYNL